MRDERFYFGVDADTWPLRPRSGGWRQCRYCKGYNESQTGPVPPVPHIDPCPVAELEKLQQQLQEPA
jgi:hypothetical protein